MTFDNRHYSPCLRWKQGEYQAVLRLKKSSKNAITPLIEIPEIGWDFETKSLKHTIDEHLSPMAKRIRNKWGKDHCFVDLKILDPSMRMATLIHPLEYIFEQLRTLQCKAIPVTSLDSDFAYNQAVKSTNTTDGLGICLRIALADAAGKGFKLGIDNLLNSLGAKPKECDLILDIGSPNFEPIEGFSKLLQITISKIPHLYNWRTFTILGGSFPSTVAEIRGRLSTVTRSEWILYKDLSKQLNHTGTRIPRFGDYTISHPGVTQLDMRLVKPASKLIYTINDAFYVRKGPNVRDNGFTQYRTFCRDLIKSPLYLGDKFSSGDNYIHGCANNTETTGNLTTWKWVGTNHHIEKQLADLSNFFSSSSIALQ